mgnify:CR=1 FL=1
MESNVERKICQNTKPKINKTLELKVASIRKDTANIKAIGVTSSKSSEILNCVVAFKTIEDYTKISIDNILDY